jgi:hypothetical protein
MDDCGTRTPYTQKKRLSESEFHLAWRLRHSSWPSGINAERERELARAVLVEGKAIKKVCDTDTSRIGLDAYVGKARLSDVCRDLYEQFFIHVG